MAKVSIKNLIRFLQEPSSYSYHPAKVEIRQTHASILAIAPPYVYKIKKHVNLGFLDFTSLSKRKRNCEREQELNSRLCSHLYLAVVPISFKNDQLFFGVEGVIVEYSLQMKQLPEGYFLDQLLRENKIDLKTLDKVLSTLVKFYQQSSLNPHISVYGKGEKIKAAVEDNYGVIHKFSKGILPSCTLEAIRQYSRRFLEKNKDLFQQRIQERRILDCHGDLHLEHIHIWQDQVSIYDCIEFNNHFRYIDVASDIAFLAMDFDFHGRPDLAHYLSTKMAELLGDSGMLLLMDFYKCYRACVRAKVEYIKSQEMEVSSEDRNKSRVTAQRYVCLALNYALFGSEPTVLMVCGRSASGKSTLANNLSQLLGWEYFSSDITRKKIMEMPIYQLPNLKTRTVLYSSPVTEKVYHVLLKETLNELNKHKNVIVDATFNLAKHRRLFIEALTKLNVPYYFLEFNISDQEMKKRLKHREKETQVVSDARIEDFVLLRNKYQQPTDVSPNHLIKIDAEVEPSLLITKVIELLSKKRLNKTPIEKVY